MEKTIYVFEDVYQEPAARSQAESDKVNVFGWGAKSLSTLHRINKGDNNA